jgi:hypothetical protein
MMRGGGRGGSMSRVERGLLRIDVAAEIRKLVQRQFKSAGDYAVELVRFAASHRPMRIDVIVRGGELKITHDGAAIDGNTIRRLAAVFDPSRTDEGRHRALVALENDDATSVLAAFSVKSPRVTVEGLVDGRPKGVELQAGRPPRRFDSRRREGFSITVRGKGRDPALEKRLLEECCRHSLVPIRVNGELISKGLQVDDCLLHVDLRNPRLHGAVGLPRTSDLVRIDRLRHGVRFEEVVRAPTSGVVFHAVVNESDDNLDSTWNTLRRAAKRLFGRLAARFPELSEQGRERAIRLLTDRFRHARDPELMARVKAFERVTGSALELEQLRVLAGRSSIHCIEPDEPPDGYDCEGRVVLRVGAHQRKFVERELGIALLPPPPRTGAAGSGEWLRVKLRALRNALRDAFGGGPGQPARDDDLDPAETMFLEAVRAEVRSGTFALTGEDRPFRIGIRMAEGQRRPFVKVARRDDRSEYRISRSHPLVEMAVEAVDNDPAFVYPALALLTEGHDGYAEVREGAQRAIIDRHVRRR